MFNNNLNTVLTAILATSNIDAATLLAACAAPVSAYVACNVPITAACSASGAAATVKQAVFSVAGATNYISADYAIHKAEQTVAKLATYTEQVCNAYDIVYAYSERLSLMLNSCPGCKCAGTQACTKCAAYVGLPTKALEQYFNLEYLLDECDKLEEACLATSEKLSKISSIADEVLAFAIEARKHKNTIDERLAYAAAEDTTVSRLLNCINTAE